MKTALIMGTLGLLLAGPAWAADHNNIDAGRPLSFDDADSIAYREQSLEFGLSPVWPRPRPLGLGLDAEYLYGFALNSHATIGFEPSIGGRSGDRDTRFDVGNVSLGLFHNFNRETERKPAFSLRGDAYLPTGRDARGAGFRLRGIASRQAGHYGRVHLNLDLNASTDPRRGDRTIYPSLALGYSRPIGYPTHFQTTGLAELSIRAGEREGTGPVVGVGVGLRRQVGVRSVVDLGVQADVAGPGGAPPDRIRLILGYSTGF